MTEQATVRLSRLADESAPAEAVIPRQLGPVRLLREIGKGGMGVVWLGAHELLSRDVAVKFVLIAKGSERKALDAFIAGAQAAAKVRHEGLIEIFNADVLEGVPYLVMEYVDGPSLESVIDKGGPLELSAVAAVAQSTCEAIAALHDENLIHRDIKPGNLLVSPDGRVLVTDFGLACERPRGTPSAGLATGSTCDPAIAGGQPPALPSISGTPLYMAPEMFQGEVRDRGDIYALGITLYELLSGTPPFLGDFDEIERQHRHAELPREPLIKRGVPEALIEVLERATHKQHLLRYRSCRHLLAAIKAAVPDARCWINGRTALLAAVARSRTSGDAAIGGARAASPAASMFDLIATRAEAKRRSTRTPLEGVHLGAADDRASHRGPADERDEPLAREPTGQAATSELEPDQARADRSHAERSQAASAGGEPLTPGAFRRPPSGVSAPRDGNPHDAASADAFNADGEGIAPDPLWERDQREAIVNIRLPCSACGCNLQGCNVRTACPECLWPIELSLDPERLVFAEGQALSRLVLALGLLVTASAISAALWGALLWGARALVSDSGVGTALIIVRVIFAAAILSVGGAIWMTSRAIQGLSTEHPDAPRSFTRTVTRSAPGSAMLGCVLLTVWIALGMGAKGGTSGLALAASGIALASGITLGCIGAGILAISLASIARRVPSGWLAGTLNGLGLGGAFVAIAAFGAGIFHTIYLLSGSEVGVLGTIRVAVYAIAGVWTLAAWSAACVLLLLVQSASSNQTSLKQAVREK
ncbi:MAG: protein kinase [Planctomycetota bacterium]|nr:protein kinase [Planctomycetota bacterium]